MCPSRCGDPWWGVHGADSVPNRFIAVAATIYDIIGVRIEVPLIHAQVVRLAGEQVGIGKRGVHPALRRLEGAKRQRGLDKTLRPCYKRVTTEQTRTLIQRGRGTGPAKPRQPGGAPPKVVALV